MILGLLPAVVVVSHLEWAAKWYGEVLGMRSVHDADGRPDGGGPSPAGFATSASRIRLSIPFPAFPTQSIELTTASHLPPGADTTDVVVRSLAVLVSDAHDVYAAATERGTKVTQPCMDLVDGTYAGGRVCRIEDLDGNKITVVQPARKALHAYRAVQSLAVSEDYSYGLRYMQRLLT